MNSINCNEKPRKRQCLGPVWLEKKNSITLSVSLSLFACHSTYASVHYWNKKKGTKQYKENIFYCLRISFFFLTYMHLHRSRQRSRQNTKWAFLKRKNSIRNIISVRRTICCDFVFMFLFICKSIAWDHGRNLRWFSMIQSEKHRSSSTLDSFDKMMRIFFLSFFFLNISFHMNSGWISWYDKRLNNIFLLEANAKQRKNWKHKKLSRNQIKKILYT